MEIVSEILQSLNATSLKKSGIIAKCKLDSRACTKYLSVMQSLNLITQSNDGESFYIISKKGTDFLQQYEKLVTLIEDDIKNLNDTN